MPTFTIETLWEQEHFTPNCNQRRAILHINGTLYLPAGPGSGKTRVFLWRTPNLLVFHNIPPEANCYHVCRQCDARFFCNAYRRYIRQEQPGRDEHRYWTYFDDFGPDEEQEMWRAANLEAAATVEDLTADFD